MPGILNRIALLVLSLTAVASQASAGEVTSADWASLVNAIRTESWKAASDLSLDILHRLPPTAADEIARVRYTYVFALSGEVVAGELSHSEFEQRIAPLVGERMLLPERPFADPSTNGPMFNQIAKTDDTDRVMMIAANADASSIHCFEYARLTAPVDLAGSLGRRGIIDARLSSFETNSQGSTAWAARLYFDDATVHPSNILPAASFSA